MNWIIENKGKTVALLISISYLIIAFHFKPEIGFRILIFLIFPLACIFFSEEMGAYKGFSGVSSPPITEISPGFIVRILGWVILFLPVIVSIIAVLSKGSH